MKAIGAIVIIVIGLFLFFDWGFLRGEVTVYPAMCSGSEKPVEDCDLIPWVRTTYRVDYAHNEVIFYWAEGPNADHGKLVKCVIRDRRNWSCDYRDGSGPVHVRDGLMAPYDLRKVFLRRWQWYLLNLGISPPFGIPEQVDSSLLTRPQ